MNILSPETGSKKMNKNLLIVLGGAVLAAVLVAVLVQITLGGKSETEVPAGENMVQVLVAGADLKAGHELEEGDLKWQDWPESAVFKSAITRQNEDELPHDVLEGRLERTFSEGEAVVESGILSETSGNYVVARLQPGERAISIKVKAESMVAGFIHPGSFVDVILTYKQRVSLDKSAPANIQEMVTLNISNVATETILEKIRVLAIDQTAEHKEDDGVRVGKTVTLAVAIRDAEKLALASEMGTLTLAMRGVGDDLANAVSPTLSDARLIKIDDEIYNTYHEMKKESGVNTDVVKIYNGAQVSEVPVR